MGRYSWYLVIMDIDILRENEKTVGGCEIER